MDNPFLFLHKAKAGNIHRLAEKLSLPDAARLLAGLPTALGVQVMAYFPEARQAELLPALRQARQGDPAAAADTAERIKAMLLAGQDKKPQGQPNSPVPPPSSAPAASLPPRPRAAAPYPPPPRQQYAPPRPGASAPAGSTAAGKRPTGKEKPVPWVPRTADASPINGPPLPGRPPPVKGDPFTSPLVRSGLLDLLGRAKERLLPQAKTAPGQPGKTGARPPAPAARPPLAGKGKGGRPEPREGMVRAGRVTVSGPPRVLGPAAARAAEKTREREPAVRRMDGKALMAAILREAGPEVRNAVRSDDPSLFKELSRRMFVFDDLIYSDDGALARVFTVAPADDAALALRFAAPALRERALRVVSPGRAEALRTPPRGRAGVDDIEKAQEKVLAVALALQAAGRILIDPKDPDLAGG